MFLFLIPLYYARLNFLVTWLHGFVWGLIVYSLLFSFALFVLQEYAHGSMRLLGFPLLVIYSACASAFWFLVFSRVNKIGTYTSVHSLLLLLSTIFYFWWLDRAMLMLFGVYEGNNLFFPMLPLMQIPWLLWAVPWISVYGILVLISMSALLIASWFATVCKYYYMSALGIYIFFLLGYFFHGKEEIPLWVSSFGVIRVYNDVGSYKDQAGEITYAMIRLCAKYPALRCIFAPESQFSYPLNICKEACALWYDNILSDRLSFCCGAYRSENEKFYNSLYVMTSNKDMQSYDKEHLLCFTEYVPSVWSLIPGVSSLFLHKEKAFTSGSSLRKPIIIPYVGSFVPYLCSELLFAHSPRDAYVSVPILCLANDSWFRENYMPRLMLWQAQLKALEWRRQIVYVAYRHAVWIDRYGNSHPLQT